MLSIKTMRALGAIDTGSVLADPLLRGLLVVPLLVALAMRGLLPLVLARVGVLAEIDLGWLLAPMAGYTVVAIAPLIAGAVVGFLLLDQRDDQTLLALRVTPLPLGAYLTYRLAAPALAGLLATLAALAVAGGQGLGPSEALLAALAATPLAPLTALALAAFARNKLEGMALVKALNLLLVAPLAGLFLPEGWSLALAALPTFWVAQAIWALQAGAPAGAFMLGAWGLGALLTALLLMRLRRVLAR
jgi:fluoroquinolone transport system permease protein